MKRNSVAPGTATHHASRAARAAAKTAAAAGDGAKSFTTSRASTQQARADPMVP